MRPLLTQRWKLGKQRTFLKMFPTFPRIVPTKGACQSFYRGLTSQTWNNITEKIFHMTEKSIESWYPLFSVAISKGVLSEIGEHMSSSPGLKVRDSKLNSVQMTKHKHKSQMDKISLYFFQPQQQPQSHHAHLSRLFCLYFKYI